MTSDRKIGEVTDLSKDITQQKCTVKYRLKVDGAWHNVAWSHSGYEDGEFLCNTAIENGRKQLLTVLGGTFETQNITVCRDGKTPKRGPVKVGAEVVETELARVPEKNYYFKHNGTVCRMFREKYNTNGVLRINNGIMCQADNQLWTVVDKW
jgi:hypothetical protein